MTTDRRPPVPARSSARREIANLLLINAVAPYVVYRVCEPYTGGLAALALSAVPPAVESVWSIVRRRKLDVMAMLVLCGLAVSLGLVALGGSERVLLLRDSLVTSLVGAVVAISAAFPRPLLYRLFQQMDPERPPELRAMRVLSVVLGIGLIIEMAVRTAMVFAMTTSRFLLISPFVQYGMTGALVAWCVFYLRRGSRRYPTQSASKNTRTTKSA